MGVIPEGSTFVGSISCSIVVSKDKQKPGGWGLGGGRELSFSGFPNLVMFGTRGSGGRVGPGLGPGQEIS